MPFPKRHLVQCACQHISADLHGDSLGRLTELRQQCAAIREVLLPDALWPAFEAWHRAGDAKAHHASQLIVGLIYGRIPSITEPIHRFVLDGDRVREGLRNQYRRDLQETWMFDPDPIERNRRSKRYVGKLSELRVATWLEADGWAIDGLEAFEEGPDIRATKDGNSTAFEVKSIGQDDDDFEMTVRSLNDENAFKSISVATPTNFLLFRLYEAAKQLARSDRRRIAVAVIDEMGWFRFAPALPWVSWSTPAFLRSESDWDDWLAAQRDKYPQIDAELAKILPALDGIWILRYDQHAIKPHLIRP